MAAYVLNTCPIHSRYVRRGRGKHVVKAENEFLDTKTGNSIEFKDASFSCEILRQESCPNKDASRRQVKSCVSVWQGLACTCVDL